MLLPVEKAAIPSDEQHILAKPRRRPNNSPEALTRRPDPTLPSRLAANAAITQRHAESEGEER
jgi:hypothetical protein